MRHLSAIAFIVLIVGHTAARAADPGEIFGAILGEFGRQIEREQQKKQLNRLRPLWQACSNGDLAACDRAARFPNLTDQARAEIWRMREAAAQRPAYERNFYACQKMDRAACQAALAYQYASDIDRLNLQKWQRTAEQQHQQALAEFRQNERNCYAGSISACEGALTQRQLDESAASAIQRHRTRLQLAEQQRQSEEQQRQLKEQQRIAAVREYNALRDKCTGGERAACKIAVAHPQIRQADIAYLNRRDRELAPIKERIVDFFANAQIDGNSLGMSIERVIGAVVAFLLLGFGAIGARYGLLNPTLPAPFRPDEPPALRPTSSIEPQAHFSEQMFPLTGHMPTDVRRALYGTQQ